MDFWLSKVTLIIPTYNRPAYLKRILDFYGRKNFKIIICDSSLESNKSYFEDKILYLHTPNLSLVEKINRGLNHVNTPYVYMCADDDFILPQAIADGIQFLESDQTYSVYHGLYFSFHNANPLLFEPYYINSINRAVEAQSESERLFMLFSNYMQVQYSLHRSVFFKKAHDLLVGGRIVDYNLQELAIAMVSAINGKIYSAPRFYGARESAKRTTVSFGAITPNIDKMLQDPGQNADLKVFFEILAAYYSNVTGENKEISMNVIRKAIDIYVLNLTKPKIDKSVIYTNRKLNFVKVRLGKYFSRKRIDSFDKMLMGKYYHKLVDFEFRYLYCSIGPKAYAECNRALDKIKKCILKNKI